MSEEQKKATKEQIDLLLKEIDLTSQQWRALWQSMGQVMPLSITGILLALFAAYQYFDKAAVLFLIFPFIISGWGGIVYYHLAELACRDRYISIIEEQVSRLSKLPTPCWETRFRPIIYGGSAQIIGTLIPFLSILGLYLLSIVEGFRYLKMKPYFYITCSSFLILSIGIFFAFVMIVRRTDTKVRIELARLREDFEHIQAHDAS
jgi:hypothetical protein